MALALHLTLAWFLQFLLNDRAIRTAMRVHQGSGDSQTIEGSSGLEALQSWAGAESTMVSPETMLSDVSVPLEGSAKPNTHPSPISLHSSSRSPSGGNLDRNDEGSRRLSQQSGKAHMSRPSDSSTTSTATVSSTRPLFLHGIRPARSSYEMHRPHRPSMESPAFSSINHEVIPEHDLDRPASPPSRPHLSRVISDPMLSKERRSLEMERESVLEGPKTISSPVRIEDGETKEEMGSPSDSPSGSPPLMGSGAIMSFVSPPPPSSFRGPRRPISPPIRIVGQPEGSRSRERPRSSRSPRSPTQRVRISMRQEGSLDLGSFGNNGLREEDEEEEEEEIEGEEDNCTNNHHGRAGRGRSSQQSSPGGTWKGKQPIHRGSLGYP